MPLIQAIRQWKMWSVGQRGGKDASLLFMLQCFSLSYPAVQEPLDDVPLYSSLTFLKTMAFGDCLHPDVSG